MSSPWWATVNLLIGNVFWGWILAPILFYNNAYGKDQSLKMNGASVLNTGSLFNSTGHQIQAISLYNKTTYDLDENSYNANAPIYITSFFARKL